MDISKTQTPTIIITDDGNRNNNNKVSSPGPPHEALFLSLPYFSVRELLVTSQVCSSLRRAVKNDDLLPWLNIVVEKPLSKRLCDDSLLRITSMARGKLSTLALIDCAKITDDGISRVVQANPLIHKLLLPGCTGLTPEGVIKAVNLLSSSSINGHTLKKIHINGIYNIKKHHLQTLNSYLLPENTSQRVVDVEICPKCENVQLVFGCPRESCQTKPNYDCKGCGFCVPRCKECGVCINSFQEELEEVVCGDILCLDCWLRLPKCSFCNQPYCKQHAVENKLSLLGSSGSSGFVCDFCNDKFISNFKSL